MKIIVLISLILFSLIIIKMVSGRKKINIKKNTKTDTTIDLEEDPKTKEYKPKE
jgi:hypothetical protein